MKSIPWPFFTMYVRQHKLSERVEHWVLGERNEAANRDPAHSE